MSSGGRRKSARISELDARKAQKLKNPNKAIGNVGTRDAHFIQKQGRKRVKIQSIEDQINNTINKHVWKAGTSSNGGRHTYAAGGMSSEASIPERSKLKLLLGALQRKDSNNFFAEPVDKEEVEFYYEVIKEPMDFSTIAAKINRGSYVKLVEFERDVNLLFTNAMVFNASDTIYYREAHSIKKLAKVLFQVLKTDPEKLESTVSNLKPKRGRPSKTDRRVLESILSDNSDCSSDSDEPVEDKCVDYMPWEAFIKSNLSAISNSSEPLVHFDGGNFGYRESLMQFVEGLGVTAHMVAEQKIRECEAPNIYKQTVASVSQLQALRCQVPATGLQKGSDIFPSLKSPGNLAGSHQDTDIESGTSNGNKRNTCSSLSGIIDQANHARGKLCDLQGRMNLSASKGFGVGSAFRDKQSVGVELGASLPRNTSVNRHLYHPATNKQPGKFHLTSMMPDAINMANDVQNNLGASLRLLEQDGISLGNGLDVGREKMNKQRDGIQLCTRAASAYEDLHSSAINKQPGKYQLTNMLLNPINMDKAPGASSGLKVQNNASLTKGLNVGWEKMKKQSIGIQQGPSLPRTASAGENLYPSGRWNTSNRPVQGHITNMMLDAINMDENVHKAPVASTGLQMQHNLPFSEGVDMATAFRYKQRVATQLAPSLPWNASADGNLYSSAIWNTSNQLDKLTNVIPDDINVEKIQTATGESSVLRMQDFVSRDKDGFSSAWQWPCREPRGSQAIGSGQGVDRFYNGVQVAANRDLNGSLEQGRKNVSWFKPNVLGCEIQNLEQRAEDFNWCRPKEMGLEPLIDWSSKQSGTIGDLLGQAGPPYWNGCTKTPLDRTELSLNEHGSRSSTRGLPDNYQLQSPSDINPKNWGLFNLNASTANATDSGRCKKNRL